MSKSALDNACKMGCNMGLSWFRSRDGVTRKPGSVTARCPICRFGSGFRLHEPAGDRQTGLAGPRADQRYAVRLRHLEHRQAVPARHQGFADAAAGIVELQQPTPVRVPVLAQVDDVRRGTILVIVLVVVVSQKLPGLITRCLDRKSTRLKSSH